MKKRPLLFLTLSLFIAGVALLYTKDKHYTPRESAAPVQSFAGASEYFNKIMANPETGEFDQDIYLNIRKKEAAYRAEKSESTLGLEWEEVGPDNIGGRTRAILVVDNNLIFAGSVTGGLFKSTNQGNTWERIVSFDKNYAITSMAVLGNGHIYVATGSSHEFFGNYFQIYPGGGLFVSTDNGDTWDYALDGNGDPIKPDNIGVTISNPLGPDYALIDKVVADPLQDNKLWVASNVGLQEYVEGTGFLPTANGLPDAICESVAISSDGMVIAASMSSSNLYLSTDGGENFEARAGSGSNEMPSNLSRLELAISPDNPNYIYGIGATGGGLGSFEGVWGSTNKGATFTKIWAGDVAEIDIDPGNQANYDLAIAVAPGSPGVIVVGALDVWVGGFDVQPEQRSFWGIPYYSPGFPLPLDESITGIPIYVHADVHAFAFDNNGTLYIGSDGGIGKSTNGANTFTHNNRFYNCTQYYSIGYSSNDKVVGGSQDNGTTYITKTQSTTEEALQILGGDGFDCEISNLDPSGDVLFGTLYFNAIFRSNDGGIAAFAPMASNDMNNSPSQFHSQIRLWEDGNAVTPYTVTYKNEFDAIIPAGTEVTVESHSWGYTFTETLPNDLGPFEEVEFMDPATTLMAAGYSGSGGVWVTRDATYFNETPEWAKVRANVGGTTTAMEWSKADGNYLWVGTDGGQVYRISGFANAWTIGQMHVDSADYALDAITMTLGSVITDISVDPNDEDHVVVTKGGFGGSAKVMETFNGTSTSPDFTDIWFPTSNDLAGMAVFGCVIESGDPNTIIVGTAFGVYATDDGGATWSPENTDPMGPVPVFDVRQQWRDPADVDNAGYIYLGTFGRGAMRSKTYEKVNFEEAVANNNELVGDLVVMPNPMSQYGWIDFTSKERALVDMDIYSINGQKLKSFNFTMNEGSNRYQFDVSDLGGGSYIIQLRKDDKVSTDKFVIIR